jgi:hypothetical protein
MSHPTGLDAPSVRSDISTELVADFYSYSEERQHRCLKGMRVICGTRKETRFFNYRYWTSEKHTIHLIKIRKTLRIVQNLVLVL